MQSKFSSITEKLQKEFPKWTNIYKDQHSTGAQFLNIFGLQYEDIEFYLQYALDNYYIGTADMRQIDIIYKSVIPSSLTKEDLFFFSGGGLRLNEMDSLKKFFEGIDVRFLETKEVFYPNPYYVDWERKVVYFKKAYNPNDTFPEGSVYMTLTNNEGEIIFEHQLPQMIHHVWNFFDEFGLLLDTPRLYGEKNREYKERLLDVFRHPANASKRGLEHLMARELGLWKEVKWYDGGIDLALKENNIVLTSIEVDGVKWAADGFTFDKSGRVVLPGSESYAGTIRKVKFIAGLQMNTFHNKKDLAFQRELYSIDRVATPMLKYYVDMITNQVPIMWDRFVWNESFWDVADKEMSGYGFIPGFKDARFLNWLKYKE